MYQRLPDVLKVTLSINGHTVSSISELDEDLIANSIGPMSLEAACMGLVREICQSIWSRAKSKVWNGHEVDDE